MKHNEFLYDDGIITILTFELKTNSFGSWFTDSRAEASAMIELGDGEE